MTTEKRDDETRRAFAIPPAHGTFDDMDLALLDPADENERALLIRAEHPELAEAIERGDEEIEIDGQAMNPRLHLLIHEILAKQLWENDPPEVWQTALRLLDAGYERHEILHMLGSALASELWELLHEGTPADPEGYVRALELLPASWEQQRNGG
jgi:hypothetical protein